jgi:dimethylaniline monooxygenase (N-oxide forming)
MHTNTSRVPAIFGDLEHETDRVYPSCHDILAYLHRYAEKFDLVPRIRFGTRVDLLGMNDTGWVVGHFGAITSNELTEREQRYWSLVTDARRSS